MRSLIRPVLFTASVLLATAGLPGCSSEEDNSGKMGGPMGKMEPGKMEPGKMEPGKMDTGKMDTGKMDTGKMDTGKMGGAMDKMEPGKAGAMDKGKME